MCLCNPGIRTPNCGSIACNALVEIGELKLKLKQREDAIISLKNQILILEHALEENKRAIVRISLKVQEEWINLI